MHLSDVVAEIRASGLADDLRAFAQATCAKARTEEFVGTLAVVREDARRLGRTLNDLLEETLVPGVEAATAVLARVAEESVLTVATTALVPFANFAADAASSHSTADPGAAAHAATLPAVGAGRFTARRSAAWPNFRRAGRRRCERRQLCRAGGSS